MKAKLSQRGSEDEAYNILIANLTGNICRYSYHMYIQWHNGFKHTIIYIAIATRPIIAKHKHDTLAICEAIIIMYCSE